MPIKVDALVDAFGGSQLQKPTSGLVHRPWLTWTWPSQLSLLSMCLQAPSHPCPADSSRHTAPSFRARPASSSLRWLGKGSSPSYKRDPQTTTSFHAANMAPDTNPNNQWFVSVYWSSSRPAWGSNLDGTGPNLVLLSSWSFPQFEVKRQPGYLLGFAISLHEKVDEMFV